jgi:hypothetical protein
MKFVPLFILLCAIGLSFALCIAKPSTTVCPELVPPDETAFNVSVGKYTVIAVYDDREFLLNHAKQALYIYDRSGTVTPYETGVRVADLGTGLYEALLPSGYYVRVNCLTGDTEMNFGGKPVTYRGTETKRQNDMARR